VDFVEQLGRTTTITAALRATGLIARSVFDGATNGMRFRAYVIDTLAPVLRPGDTVILDNLNAHKVAGVREAIEAVGARVLYLPPYSPDFNPCMDGSCGSRISIGLGELVGCGHVYGV
jgi:transposase